MNERTIAKRLLRHYLTLIAGGANVNLDPDCMGEIDDIVDLIVDAAVSAALDAIHEGALDL